uniref:Protocadherin gamma-C3 n=1 Tax=Anas zonorhyncha TaxID=75864 RepID=A0A8B9VR59_9AVES
GARGWLWPLDREQSALQQLVLTAVDGGDPPKSGTAQISVRVVDTNDNPPAFDRSTYTVNLLENSPPGTLVVKLNASDPDEGSNGDVIYSFGSYTPQKVRQLFSVDPHSGEVRVNGTLDYEEASSYEIYVQATDQGPVSMAGHCKVLVNIVDANDNVPEVVLTSLYSPVPEDAKSGTVVALMSVTDQDSGLNKQVSLRIPPGLPFMLNSFKNSYTLVTQGKLDHEKAAAYNITVTATDSGIPPLSSQKVIHVEISDINDNPPRFEEPVYSVYVPENNPLGVLLCTIKATDPDVAENAYVSYSLLDGEIEGLPVTSYVSIKSDSGNMYAVKSFDYETLREFQVVVQAQDAGIPSLSSTVSVHIYVVDENDHAPQILSRLSSRERIFVQISDVNDNPPEFTQDVYTISVNENNNPMLRIGNVNATDADAGKNSRVSYALVREDKEQPDVSINSENGDVYILRPLDYEEVRAIEVTVRAADGGSPALSAEALLRVLVRDENDNAPVVLHPPPDGSAAAGELVPRWAQAGYLVAKVVAVDADAGQNAWLSYELAKATEPGLFRVGLHSGEVRTARAVTERDAPRHRLVVLVRDRGQPPRSSTATLTITLVDGFSEAHLRVSEEAPATDPDGRLTLYLIICLSCVSALFLATAAAAVVVRLRRARQSMAGPLPTFPKSAAESSAGSLPRSYVYDVCFAAGTVNSEFRFLRPLFPCFPDGLPHGPGDQRSSVCSANLGEEADWAAQVRDLRGPR